VLRPWQKYRTLQPFTPFEIEHYDPSFSHDATESVLLSGGIVSSPSLLPACLPVHQFVASELPIRLRAGASAMIGSLLGSRLELVCVYDKCKRRNKNLLIIRALCVIPHAQKPRCAHVCKQTSRYFNNAESQQTKNLRVVHLRARCTPGQMEIAELFKSLLL